MLVHQTMKWIAILVLIATAFTALAEDNTPTSNAQTPSKGDWRSLRPIIWDSVTHLPPDYPKLNPYGIMMSFSSGLDTILDHSEQPHVNGHAIQIIMDGGNGLQDPPKADGSPGGDDSLAFGNMNMIRMSGANWKSTPGERVGLFFARRGFVPLNPPGRAYYLRLWEGENVTDAPYYQNSVEYHAGKDTGGGMIISKRGPVSVRWKFGPSQPRPK